MSYFANFFTNLKQWEESIGDVEPFIGLKFRKKIQKMLRVMAKKYLSRKTELSQVTNWQNIWMFKVLSVLKYTYCNFYKLTKNYTPALHDKGFHILYCIKKRGKRRLAHGFMFLFLLNLSLFLVIGEIERRERRGEKDRKTYGQGEGVVERRSHIQYI